ncbi:hypothetical protein [Gemmatimonas sp.]|nr:hypothetical protein [Gemmatimonas sp.]
MAGTRWRGRVGGDALALTHGGAGDYAGNYAGNYAGDYAVG